MSVSGSLGLLAAVLLGVASAGPFGGGSSTTEKIKLRVDPLGKNAFALYGIPDLGRMEHEIFWAITKPGEIAPVEVTVNSSFVLRSTDMKFRAMVVADLNPDPDTKVVHPWKLCFFNTMLDPGAVIELKHGSSGFVWIEEGAHVCQVTDHSHNFELHNREKKPIASIQVSNPKDEL
mmetsp:Transcript_19362/g.60892  ORF Transcript_19362/g.60892 Transcript_19362/m.60892 type:complete len:176 (+) Transcript_19362:77-604(+)